MTTRPGSDFLAAEAGTLAAGVTAVIGSPEYQAILRRYASQSWLLRSHDPTVNPLPTVPRLLGDDKTDLFGRLSAVITRSRYTVEMAEAPDGANGCTGHDLSRVYINPRRSPLQRAKTLAHELAHVSLHAPGPGKPYVSPAWRELEAETCCWLTLRWLSIDGGSFSCPFLAKYTAGRGGEDYPDLRTEDAIGRAVDDVADTAWWVTKVLPPAPAELLAGSA